MAYEYFRKTPLDERYYRENLADRLPERILDVHTHINRPEHVASVPPERLADDWAFQCGTVMTAEDAAFYFSTLYPDRLTALCGFPMPIREADIAGNNAYIADCVRRGKIAYGMMCVKPEDSAAFLERELTEQPFSGVKPYPDMVSGKKGAEIGIFSFLPHSQLALFERLGVSVMLHLPRAGRMPDDDNIRELKEIRDRYPALKLCLAHLGRCFTPYYLEAALDKLGTYADSFYYDTAAVSNPRVFRLALERLPLTRVLFGTDLPIFLWHGRRRWTEKGYFNLCREDFPWNTHEEKDRETEYTFYVYWQLNHLLDTMDQMGFGGAERQQVFYENARQFLSRTE